MKQGCNARELLAVRCAVSCESLKVRQWGLLPLIYSTKHESSDSTERLAKLCELIYEFVGGFLMESGLLYGML